MYVNTQSALLADLTVGIAVGGTYHTPKMALYFVDYIPTLNSQLSDFGDLTGNLQFTVQNVAWGTPFVNDVGQAEVRGAMLTWATTYTPPAAITAYGWVELSTDGLSVLRAERFAVSYTFNRSGQDLSIVPCLRKGN